MNIVYRSESDGPLSASQIDQNFRTLADAIAEIDVGDGVHVVDVLVEGRTITFLMSDGSEIGPKDLPTGGIADAPSDGRIRGRKNAGWVEIPAGGIADAASDGKVRGRKDAGWTEVVPEAPADGKIRGRKDGAWAEIVASGGGLQHRGPWNDQLSIVDRDVVEHADMLWMARGSFGKTAPVPSFDQTGYWLPMTFPTIDVSTALTSRIRHQFNLQSRYDKADLASILDQFETRLKALESKSP